MSIQVFVRCRPLRALEKRVLDLTNLEVKIQDGKIFSFDRVFDQESSQDELYRHVVRPLIDQVISGFNCTVFAYGQTGTGKTYTMEGLIPLAINHIYKACTRPGRDYVIRVSYLELYNEEAYDLLTVDSTKLKIYDDLSRKGCVHGCTEQVVLNIDDIHEILRLGSEKRRTNATLLNACSSRSHTIFTIGVTVRDGQLVKSAKLNLVDLAGSENIGRSGAQDKRAREAGNINQSLLALGRVVTALAEGRSHVPYRESKLTRILQDSLGGTTRASMIATISPAESDLGTTIGTLEYASQSRSIVNQPEANLQMGPKRQCSDEMDLEMRVRNEVAAEFKREIKNLRESYDLQFLDQKTRYEQNAQSVKKEYEKEMEEMQADMDLKQKELEKTQQELIEVREEIEGLKKELEARTKEAKIQKKLAEYRETLLKDFEEKLKEKEVEITKLKEEISTMDSESSEERKADKIRTRALATDECGDYANMTFDGGDELLVGEKKARKKVGAGAKKRIINPAIMLSGKKKRLKNNDSDTELSPVPVTRVTRSRATRKKLDL